jgi:hypothetical protein
MATRYAWVLNLDGDLELARGPGYCPTAGVRRALAGLETVCAAQLLADGDMRVDDDTPDGAARGMVGRAFCPTPRALARLARAGAEIEPSPPLAVLRKVNARSFAAALGQTMHHARFVSTLADARAHLALDPEIGDAWRIKRSYGMAGRGHRIVSRSPRERDIAFLPRWIAEGGAQIEPNVPIDCEYAQHAAIERDGALHAGALTRQEVDRSGAWLASARVGDGEVSEALRAAVFEQLQLAAHALRSAGYFGPFGVDAFTWRAEGGEPQIRARSEINARYSMGFAVGMGIGRGASLAGLAQPAKSAIPPG